MPWRQNTVTLQELIKRKYKATEIARPDIARMDNVAPARKGGNHDLFYIVRVSYCSVLAFYDVSDNVK